MIEKEAQTPSKDYAVVAIIGVVALIVAFILFIPVASNMIIRHTWIKSTATIIDEHKSRELLQTDTATGPKYAKKYQYIYTYKVDGVDYGNSTGYLLNRYEKETCPVFVNPDNYTVSRTLMETSSTGYFIGAVSSLIFGLIEIVYVFKRRKTYEKI